MTYRMFSEVRKNLSNLDKAVRLPSYSEDEIKKIEMEFDTEEGWVKADEVFGEDRLVESVFVSVFLDRKKKKD